MRRFHCALLFAALAFLAGVPASAHEEFQVAGTIAKLDPDGIAVKTAEGKIIAVRFGGPTRFWRGEERAPTVELKMGERVDIRAYGDTLEDLLALDVTLAPNQTPPATAAPAR
jgi:hypothetical protein